MLAEVEAVRGSVEEERQRLSEKLVVLEREKRENQAASRAESRRLAEQVLNHTPLRLRLLLLVTLVTSITPTRTRCTMFYAFDPIVT